jgi:hypothetical protein
MQFARTIVSDSATFNEQKKVENRLWPKSEFSWPKKIKSCDRTIQILHSKDQQDQTCKQNPKKLQANPPASDAQAIKLCPSQQCCKVQATLQVRFVFCVIAINFNSRSGPQN